MAPVSMILSDL